MAIVNYFAQPTPSGSTNTKGSWEEFTASTAGQIARIKVGLTGVNTGIANHLIDIGTGAGGAEVVLINNLLLSTNFATMHGQISFDFPVNIPASTRLVVRSQSSTASLDSQVGLQTWQQATSESGTIYTMGADTSDSGGLVVDPGADTGVKGAWVEFEDSTPADFKWVCFAFGSRNNSTMTTNSWNFDLGVGAASSEVVTVPDVGVMVNSANDLATPLYHGIWEVNIAAGSRLAIRARSFLTSDATDRLLDVVLYAGTQPFFPAVGGAAGGAHILGGTVVR